MFSCILNIRTFLCISLHAQGIFWFPRMKKGMDRKSPSFIKFHHTSTNLRFFAGLAGFEQGKWWESKGFNKLSVLFKAEKASRKNTPHLPRPTIPSSLKAWKIPGKKRPLSVQMDAQMPEEIGNLKQGLRGLHFHQGILVHRISSCGGQAHQGLGGPVGNFIPYKEKVHLHMFL